MTPRAKELLSWLIGLGPVGEPVHANPEWIAEDLGIRKRPHRVQLISRLVREKAVKRLGGDVLIVLKRIPAEKDWEVCLKKVPVLDEAEEIEIAAKQTKKPFNETRIGHILRGRALYEAKREEFRRALESVPADTRDLTARLCGDPLPGRSAYDRARMQANG